MRKQIITVENHHEVLDAWSRENKQNVITLDYHTDSHPAFLNSSYHRATATLKETNPQFQSLQKKITIEAFSEYMRTQDITLAIAQLKHDEHIDFATTVEIINKSFCLAKHDGNNSNINNNIFNIEKNSFAYNNQKIIEYTPTCTPTCTRTPHNDYCTIDIARDSVSNAVLNDAITRFKQIEPNLLNQYILDIDCDYFTSTDSLLDIKSPELTVFKKMIAGATIITIAKESRCVEACRIEYDTVTSEEIYSWLNELINRI